MLLTRYPDSPLSRVVECIWHHEGASVVHGRENVLPDGRFQLVLNLDAGNATVCGLRAQHVVIDPARIAWMMGVVFRPGGAAGVVRASALEFRDRSVALDLVWGSEATRIVDQLRDALSSDKRLRILQAVLTDRLRRNERAIHPAVDYALQAFIKEPDVVPLKISSSIRTSLTIVQDA